MKALSRCKAALLVVFMPIAVLAGGANAPNAIELDEVTVTGMRERERKADPPRPVVSGYQISVQQDDPVAFQIEPWALRQPELLFRRSSVARQGNGLPLNSSLSTDRLVVPWNVVPNSLPVRNIVKLRFTLAANVGEADGLPASIPFGPHSSLVNLDYLLLQVIVPEAAVRLRFAAEETTISLPFAIHPQTRRCERDLLLIDEGSNNPLRLMLITDSIAECLRVEEGREGDLIFAESVPGPLRQAVRETYEPIAARLANRLGSEPGQVFVAWWQDSPYGGYRFEPSWNRNNLLLFNGAVWQQGADPAQRESLRADFMEEQIRRRIRQTDAPGAFTESAVRYLLRLFTSERSGDVSVWLVEALPVWIERCAGDLQNKALVGEAHGGLSSIACGLVLQFVYDAVARARSAGGASLSDTWQSLLGVSYRRNESGVKPSAFLASSREAQGIAQGLLDGSMDWSRFAAQMEDLGVQLRVEHGAGRPAVTVVSLMHFDP